MAKKKPSAKNKKSTKKAAKAGRVISLIRLGKPAKKNGKITFLSLYKWNVGLAALHLLQGIVIIILSKASTLPVTTHFLTTDTLATQTAGHPVLAVAVRHLFDVNLAYLVAAFFFMSAIAHLVVATVYRKRYEANLKTGINKTRWIEYGISASTMMVAIGLLGGIYDLSSIIMIITLVFIMSMMGLVMEVHNQSAKKTNWLSYIIGCVAGIIPWVVFTIYVKGAYMYGSGKIPAFVYWIYASMFVLFASFAINMFLQYRRKGKWADYLYGERIYMILSLVAKTALAWQIFAGTLRP